MSNGDNIPRIDYSGKDFAAFKENLITYIKSEFPTKWTDFYTADFGMLLINLQAYLADVLSYYMDVNANEAFITTFQERKRALALAKQVGYKLKTASAASVTLNATVVGNTQEVLMLSGTQITVANMIFELVENFILPAGEETRTITAVEGQTYTKDFTSPQPTDPPISYYALDYDRCIDGTIRVFVGPDENNLLEWQYVENLFLSNPGDLVFTTEFDINDRATILFGDSIYKGTKPDTSSLVRVVYRVGGGEQGNVPPGTVNTTIIGETNTGTVSVVIDNSDDTFFASGGKDRETIDEARVNIPAFVRTADNLVSQEDYDTFINSYSDPVYGSVALGRSFLRRVTNYNRSGSGPEQYRDKYLRAPILPVNAIDIYIWASSIDISGNTVLVAPSEGLKNSLKIAIEDKSLICTDHTIYDGINREIAISLEYGLKSSVNYTTAATDLEDRLKAFFNWDDPERRDEINVGETIYPSNILAWLENSPYIRWIKLLIPSEPVILNPNEIPVLGTYSLVRI